MSIKPFYIFFLSLVCVPLFADNSIGTLDLDEYASADLNNDCFIDKFDLEEMVGQWLKAPSPLDVNLLANSGFEDELDFWTTDNGTIRETDPEPHSGELYFYGAENGAAQSHTWQRIDLLAAGFMAYQLDNELLTVSYGGYQSGWHTQEDMGMISLEFLDEEMAVMESYDLGWHWSNNTWLLEEGAVAMPIGARYVVYAFDAQRVEGSHTDAYLDDAFVVIFQAEGGVEFMADLNYDNVVNIVDFAIMAGQWLTPPASCVE